MRISSTVTCLVLSLAQQAISTPVQTSVRKKITFEVHQDRAAAVKEAFQHAWDGYYKYAWTHDELHPVAKTFGDSRLEALLRLGSILC
jgi:mannosyl-oligosaccharide alpha-1,2-mannosidase